jgi:hypothetical protein
MYGNRVPKGILWRWQEYQELTSKMCWHNIEFDPNSKTIMLHIRPNPMYVLVWVKLQSHCWVNDKTKEGIMIVDLTDFVVDTHQSISERFPMILNWWHFSKWNYFNTLNLSWTSWYRNSTYRVNSTKMSKCQNRSFHINSRYSKSSWINVSFFIIFYCFFREKTKSRLPYFFKLFSKLYSLLTWFCRIYHYGRSTSFNYGRSTFHTNGKIKYLHNYSKFKSESLHNYSEFTDTGRKSLTQVDTCGPYVVPSTKNLPMVCTSEFL